MTIEIFDNYLPPDIFSTLQANVMSFELPWFHQNTTVADGDGKPSDTHRFWWDYQPSQQIGFIAPLIKKLHEDKIVRCLDRIKGNTTFPSFMYSHYKTGKKDYWKEDLHIDNENYDITGMKAAIFYINTTDGQTVFQMGKNDFKFVDGKENRLVVFDMNIKHAGLMHTDTNISRRVNLNFNFF